MRRSPLRSPPRMRGKGNLLLDGNIPLGITPAYAGKRDLVISGSGDIEDHPRVCGEKSTSEAQKSSDMGSPPRMRGKDADPHTKLRRYGITPAYAGKSGRTVLISFLLEDHPRVCGEKEDMKKAGLNPIGSPPRVRGKVACQGPRVARYRITPAYAGKRGHRRFGPGTIRDHPRVCGEKYACARASTSAMGSPPRMRGKVSGDGRRIYRHGITPAYAGKRRCPRSRPGRTRDHPRVCGEKTKKIP